MEEQSKKQNKRTLMNKAERRVLIIGAALSRLMLPLHASATNKLENTIIYKGLKNLIQDAINALTLMTAGVVAFFFIKNMYKYVMGEDDEKPAAKKSAQKTIVIGVLIILTETIVNVVFSYFV